MTRHRKNAVQLERHCYKCTGMCASNKKVDCSECCGILQHSFEVKSDRNTVNRINNFKYCTDIQKDGIWCYGAL